MKYPALICVLLASPAWADICNCVKHGRVAYQGTPCSGASQPAHITASAANEFVGCFAMDTGSPWTNSEQHNLAEIRAVSSGYALAIDGITTVWRPGTPTAKCIRFDKIEVRAGH